MMSLRHFDDNYFIALPVSMSVLWDNIFQTRLLHLFIWTVRAQSTNGCATYWTMAVQFPTGAGFGNVQKATATRFPWVKVPRGIRYEQSSSARTLGSWVRIPLEAWLYVYIYSVFVLFFCVDSGLATGWFLVQWVLPTVYRIKKVKSGQGPTKGYRGIDR
jgi:hypothetical protein